MKAGALLGCTTALQDLKGWNNLKGLSHPLFTNAWGDAAPDVYFVHSYAAAPDDPACTTAEVLFADQPVTAAVWQGALAACQFHPEKSGPQGQRMLERWLGWVGKGEA